MHISVWMRRLAPCFLLVFLLAGCGDETPPVPHTLTLEGRPVRAAPLASQMEGKIRFRVLGSTSAKKAEPVPDVPVRIALASIPKGSTGTVITAKNTITDAGGAVQVEFTTGNLPGVYEIEASLPDYPDIAPARLSVLGGVRIEGAGQDGWVGTTLAQKLSVTLEQAPGKPVALGDGLVRFMLMKAPEGTHLSQAIAATNTSGTADSELSLGSQQGRIDVAVSIVDGIPDVSTRLEPVHVSFFAIDRWSVITAMLGGVALFLFGMKMMTESLQFVAGDKLRSLLNMLTTNRFMAVGAGTLITMLIQSSTACSVMVVGFVNAGLMQLEQAIGVIMGANIGTTVTAQIISLNVTRAALPAVIIGVTVLLMAKRQRTKYYASIVIGFGLLFLGMLTMSKELGELKESASLVELFAGLDCMPGPGGMVPFWQFVKAIGCGIVATIVLQSSAGTVGLLITVASAGLIDAYAAFGILLGDNIGTTITAFVASIGTTTAARRAGIFHAMFNIIGVTLVVALNYVQYPFGSGRPIFMVIANAVTPGNVFNEGENLPRFLANAHSLFNVGCTFLFVWFVPVFARVCRMLVKDRPDDAADQVDTRRLLEPHLLRVPSVAIQQVWNETGIMLEKAREAVTEGYSALLRSENEDWQQAADEAKTLEEETDEMKRAITSYLGSISLTTLNESQSEMFPHLVRTVNDAERVADLGKHLSKLAKRMNKSSITLTPEAVADMNGMAALVKETLELAEKTVNINADGIEMSGGGAVLRQKLLVQGQQLDKQVRAKASELRKNHEQRHEAGVCDIKSGVVFLDVANSLARAAGSAVNIIEAACHTSGQNPISTRTSASMRINRTSGRLR